MKFRDYILDPFTLFEFVRGVIAWLGANFGIQVLHYTCMQPISFCAFDERTTLYTCMHVKRLCRLTDWTYHKAKKYQCKSICIYFWRNCIICVIQSLCSCRFLRGYHFTRGIISPLTLSTTRGIIWLGVPNHCDSGIYFVRQIHTVGISKYH